MRFHDWNDTTDLTAIGLNNKVSKHSVGQPGVLFRVYQTAAKGNCIAHIHVYACLFGMATS